MTRLTSLTPSRTFKESRRSLTGRIAVDDGAVSFESSLERDLLVLLDFDAAVKEIREQPFTIRYREGGASRRYTPDVLARFERLSVPPETVVYEVKHRDELRANWIKYENRFRVAIRHCKQAGWRFLIVTEREIRTPLLKNAQFLRRYRNLPRDPLMCGQLMYSIKALGETTPQALLAAAYWTNESRMTALPMLWAMVAAREIRVDLNRSITMASPIWLPE